MLDFLAGYDELTHGAGKGGGIEGDGPSKGEDRIGQGYRQERIPC